MSGVSQSCSARWQQRCGLLLSLLWPLVLIYQDVVALTSLPLPGYQVSSLSDSEVDRPESMFKVFHARHSKVYYFQTDDKQARNR